MESEGLLKRVKPYSASNIIYDKEKKDQLETTQHHQHSRYVIHIFICLSVLGCNYCLDMPATVQKTIIEVMRVNLTQYELLYSVFAWPNVVLVVIGGLLVDKVFGLRFGYIFFLVLVCLGQVLFALGPFLGYYWLMVVGRTLLGSGSEIFMLTANVYTASLFKHHQLSFAVGLLYSMGSVGEVLSFSITKLTYDHLTIITDHKTRLGTTLMLGVLMCLISLVAGLIVFTLNYKNTSPNSTEKKTKCSLQILKDLLSLSISFWIFTLIAGLYYVGHYSFLSITQVFFIMKYGCSSSVASIANGLTYTLPIFLFPVAGFLIDWTGYKLCWGGLSILLGVALHSAYSFSGPLYFLPFICTLVQGVSFVMFNCSIWPSGFLLVDKDLAATAYGIVYASYDLTQALTTIATGSIADSYGYLLVQILFTILLFLCLTLTIFLYILDITIGHGKLNRSGREGRNQVSTNGSIQ